MPATISGHISAILSWKSPWFVGVLLTREGNRRVEQRIVGQVDKRPVLRTEVALDGDFETTRQFGRQFRFTQMRPTYTPRDASSMGRFLAANCPGFHTQNALKWVHDQGVDRAFPLLLESSYDSAIAAIGLTEEQLTACQIFLRNHVGTHSPDGITLLSRHGFDRAFATAALQIYSEGEIRNLLRLAPYALVHLGAPLSHLDAIARGRGRELADAYQTITRHCQQTGSTLLTADDLGGLGIDAALRKRMCHWRMLSTVGSLFGPASLLRQEQAIAQWLLANAQQQTPLEINPPDGDRDDQWHAVVGMAQSSPFVLVGGPGTGKTHTLGRFIHALKGQSFALLAPTGKAAKRLQQVAPESEALTIHRFLYRFQPVLALPPEQRALALPSIVIIDEASMVDVPLFAQLLALLPVTTHLILVGDADQLPSICPGNVLRDTLARFAHQQLSRNRRQGMDSSILANARKVNSGNPLLSTDAETTVHDRSDPASLLNLLSYYLHVDLPRTYDVRNDVQVISPTYAGPLGVHALNAWLRDNLNPAERPHRFAPGDRVVVNENNYRLGIVNGDTGTVTSVSTEGIVVSFVTGEVAFSPGESRILDEAWALTTHKAQGCEYKVVILCLTASMPPSLLSRALLYTAMTRARERLIILGSWKAIEACTGNTAADVRTTALPLLLQKERPPK